MKIFIDIDETICYNSSDLDYTKAKPIKENIKRMNSLFDSGHNITCWSARGTGTGINWYSVTIKQFKKWGVKYHPLSLGKKPIFDLLIDDKALNIADLSKIESFLNNKSI